MGIALYLILLTFDLTESELVPELGALVEPHVD